MSNQNQVPEQTDYDTLENEDILRREGFDEDGNIRKSPMRHPPAVPHRAAPEVKPEGTQQNQPSQSNLKSPEATGASKTATRMDASSRRTDPTNDATTDKRFDTPPDQGQRPAPSTEPDRFRNDPLRRADDVPLPNQAPY